MTCSQCSAEYERGSRGPAGSFCSPACRVRAWRLRFPTKYQKQLAVQSEQRRRRARPASFRCQHCASEFCTLSVRGRFPKYCSPACKEQDRATRYKERHGVSRQSAWLAQLSNEKLESVRARGRAEAKRAGWRACYGSASATIRARNHEASRPNLPSLKFSAGASLYCRVSAVSARSN